MITQTNIIILLNKFRLLTIKTGIIFWTVEINNKTKSLTDFERDKNHPWKGAAPSLIIILIIMKVSKIKLYFIKQIKTQII